MNDVIVAFAELEESLDQKLRNYSSGMRARIDFSVATRDKVDVLLIDEALAVGDAASQTTIVFFAHDMGAVRQFCDHAILIDECSIAA